jgi:hypothetical protein
MRLTFGKHAGKLLEHVPTSYLAWMLECCEFKRWSWEWQVRQELESRVDEDRPEPEPHRGVALPLAGVDELAGASNRDLTRRHHPHRGGTTEVMQACNDAHDRLRQRFGFVAR